MTGAIAFLRRHLPESLGTDIGCGIGGAEASGNRCESMQKWLDDQATLVSGARLQPTYQPLRPTPKSQSKDSPKRLQPPPNSLRERPGSKRNG
ncbi:unnamed protein product [Rodentolepis nana]|uniref:3'-phosphate/5'-hydroxy nucleic acid ligase n=1 Tax=Rodentolepis nana TaxID=102285 RepID=A0A0R3TT47_RODNA|nr:unnamed protein product [Rodentolepis nana]